jgi:hypothetical protein
MTKYKTDCTVQLGWLPILKDDTATVGAGMTLSTKNRLMTKHKKQTVQYSWGDYPFYKMMQQGGND